MEKYDLIKLNLKILRRMAIEKRIERKEMFITTDKSKMKLINYILASTELKQTMSTI